MFIKLSLSRWFSCNNVGKVFFLQPKKYIFKYFPKTYETRKCETRTKKPNEEKNETSE